MTGTVVFSVDAELGWGLHDLHPLSEEERERSRQSRQRWMELHNLFEAYGVPATWAVVAHLLTDEDRYRERHPYSGEWFETAERGMQSRPDQWLGQDLVEAVAQATVDNELASHSFSHAVFTDIPEQVADAECELAREVGDGCGFDFTSFVFPRNRVDHLEILAEHGFDCYRGRRPAPQSSIPGSQGLGMLIGSLTGTIAPPTVTPRIDEHGLVNIPASIFLGGFRGRPWSGVASITGDPAVTLAKQGIDRACERDEVFHMWLHPHDLTRDRYVRRVTEILDYVTLKRSHSELQVQTMGEIATAVRNGHPIHTAQSSGGGQDTPTGTTDTVKRK